MAVGALMAVAFVVAMTGNPLKMAVVITLGVTLGLVAGLVARHDLGG